MASSKIAWLGSAAGVLRSQDGGSDWTRVLSSKAAVQQTFFLGTQDAWAVTAAGGSGHQAGAVWRTTDSGQRWSKGNVPVANGGAVEVDFVNSSQGWLLLRPAHSGPYQLLGTTDGGVRWSKERGEGLPTTAAGADSACALGRLRAQITFSTATNGFLADTCPDTGGGTLLFTHTGGRSWSRVKLPNLETEHRGSLALSAPVFLTAGSAILVATLSPGHFRFAMTEDGGGDWWWAGKPLATGSSLLSVPVGVLAPGRWVVGGTSRLFETTNQGSSWKSVASSADLAHVTYLNLLPSGQALAATDGSQPAALRSSDGGKHWTSEIV